ncbi:MAG: F0F1 ATP synthase subunit A [Candidatus Levyibacteriota bacterium]
MLSLAAEKLTQIGPLPITNTLVDTLLVDIILIALAWYISKKASLIPTKLQGVIELIVDGLYGLTETVAGKQTMVIFPFVMSFFLFILVSNWSGLLPVLTSVGFYHGKEFIPLIRSASTDLNTTLALALISLVATHSMSIIILGWKQYVRRFLSLNPLALYTGILEAVSELTKIISFSFRLFGNIFVGEMILGTLSTAFAFVLPIPIILYELFVGAIQATIFALLTMAFMAIFTSPHGEDAH